MRLFDQINKFQKNHKKNKTNLPTLFFFTNRKKFPNIFATIQKLPKNSAIIIREYDLNYQERLEFALKIIKIAKSRGTLTFIGKDLPLAIKLKANGVHFSDFDQSWQKYLYYQRYNRNFLFSCSCHSQKFLQKAINYNFNYYFLSAIFPTSSHPGTKTLGQRNLTKIINQTAKNSAIYALGGINKDNIKLLNNSKVYGIAGISYIANLT